MTSPAQKVSSACQKKELSLFLFTELQDSKTLLGVNEFEMLCFLLQIDASWTGVSIQPQGDCCNCKCIEYWNFEDRIATLWAYSSYRTLENTQTKQNVDTVCRDRSTQKTKLRRGDAGSGSAGAISYDHRAQVAVACHLKPTSLFACWQTGEKTHRVDSTVPSSPSLTSSFSLLPSYCVGGSANRKATISEWDKGQKTARESIFNLLS